MCIFQPPEDSVHRNRLSLEFLFKYELGAAIDAGKKEG